MSADAGNITITIWQLISACLFSNLLTVLFLYSAWSRNRSEGKEHRSGENFVAIMAMLFILLFTIFGIFQWPR
jgi:hypothetical protein